MCRTVWPVIVHSSILGPGGKIPGPCTQESLVSGQPGWLGEEGGNLVPKVANKETPK